LPCEESSFIACKPVLKEAFDANGHLVPIDDQESSPTTSFFGELVKLYGLWYGFFSPFRC
jgi:hypothetical protein